MNNANQPIVPFFLEKGVTHPYQLLGLTKREHLAGLITQGICSNETSGVEANAEKIVFLALEITDELLKQLEQK